MDEREYLVRVERLSLSADLGTTDDARRRFSLVAAINSVKNVNQKKKLMAEGGLDWDELTIIVKNKPRSHSADLTE